MPSKRLVPLSILLLLSLFLTSQAASTTGSLQNMNCVVLGSATDIGTCVAASIPFATVGLMISLLIIAITYMAGEVFNIQQLKGWYKKELWEVAKSAMIIAVMFALLIILSGTATALAGNSAIYTAPQTTVSSQTNALVSNLQGLYSVVQTSYLNPTLYDTYTSLAAVYGLSMGVGLTKGLQPSLWLPLIIIPMIVPSPPFIVGFLGSVEFGSRANILTSNFLESSSAPSMSLLRDIITIVVLPVTLLLQVQVDLFSTIVVSGFGVFLPLGIIMRSMPFLRRLGGTLIAIGISLSLIYPTMLVVFNMPVTNYFASVFPRVTLHPGGCPAVGKGNIVNEVISGMICGVVLNGVHSIVPTYFLAQSLMGHPIPSSYGGDTAINNAFDTGYSVGLGPSINSAFPSLNLIINYTLGTLLQFLLFIFDLFIGITLTGSIAKSMGGSLRLSIGKMKLG